jgi:hypothetical protein
MAKDLAVNPATDTWSYDIYTVFDKGRCYGFQAGVNETHVDHWRPGASDNQAISALDRLMHTVRIAAPVVTQRTSATMKP